MYYRNGEVDRTITNYRNKIYDKKQVETDSNYKEVPRKNDGFLENYNIDFVRKFPHLLAANAFPQSPELKKKEAANPLRNSVYSIS
eukprot:CAMPEP_0114578914 /NCGR_PEP_ID=MMETSP0125-20121206/3391_1 /TAXON_ID=485358 ORGANISM="Aristerostoma sp., Strain ATCC 50986" /NCGR_SAMPLE_ID=MMETSP0125 /ASSEMBLY_ACC=CAM_ASM_000245 /LENGTH=85 /DNA_ID=CAMNT_0001769335 /DNA_START=505 /DNA_END=762 /DNA_ORIENTATION=+